MPKSDFTSVGKLLGFEQWVQGNDVVPPSLETVLSNLQEEVSTPSASEEDDGDDPAELLARIAIPSPPPAPEPEGSSVEEQLSSLPDQSTSPEEEEGSDEEEEGQLDATQIMASMGTRQEASAADIFKAWMNFHDFVLVKSVDQLREVVKQAYRVGKCSLDLETEGLDNRIYEKRPEEIRGPIEEYWDGPRPDRLLQTVHKIVGYCLSVDGKAGYYVPVRHEDERKNLDPVEVGKVIKELCLAAQPEIREEGKQDPLGSALIKPGKVKLYFWHAKFDQEFLLPVTGIDFWHPDSFEDGMLMYYCIYSDDKSLGLKPKSEKNLCVRDDKGVPKLGIISKDPTNRLHERVTLNEKGAKIPYDMIELKDLFVKGREIKFASLTPEEALHYACSDAICTLLHWDPLYWDRKKGLDEVLSGRYVGTYRLEKQVSQVIRWMERLRVKINREYVKEKLKEAEEESNKYHKIIMELAEQHPAFRGLDVNSAQQLGNFLFDESGLDISPKPERNVKSEQYKTDADTLEKLVEDHADVNPVLLTVVKYRQVEKVKSTYLEGMYSNCDKNDELRCQFKQTGAPTGRFTAPKGDPKQGFGGIPFHGIPATYDEKKPKVATALRKAFVAREGYVIVKVDYSGEELRIVTNLSKEPVWIKEFLEGTGDLHSITARAFFGKKEVNKQERQQGKKANFSLVYGGGAMAIMRSTGCSKQEGARRKQNFDKSVPTFTKWVVGQKAKCKRDGGVWTPFGRWMAIPNIHSEDKAIIAGAERCSINYPIQGAGADIMKASLVLLYKEFWRLGWVQDGSARFILNLHDEIVFEVKREKLMEVVPVIERVMKEPGRRMRDWTVPLEVEPLVDETWDAKYDFNKMVHGRPANGSPENNEVEAGGRYYQKIPSFLERYLVPDYQGGASPSPPQEAARPPSPPPTSAVPSEVPSPSPSQPPKPRSNGKPSERDMVVFALAEHSVTYFTLKRMHIICLECGDANGKLLHVVERGSGITLIDPSLGITVDPVKFKWKLGEYNL